MYITTCTVDVDYMNRIIITVPFVKSKIVVWSWMSSLSGTGSDSSWNMQPTSDNSNCCKLSLIKRFQKFIRVNDSGNKATVARIMYIMIAYDKSTDTRLMIKIVQIRSEFI